MKIDTFLALAVRHIYYFKQVFLCLLCLKSVLLNFMPRSSSYLISFFFLLCSLAPLKPIFVSSNIPLLNLCGLRESGYFQTSVSFQESVKKINKFTAVETAIIMYPGMKQKQAYSSTVSHPHHRPSTATRHLYEVSCHPGPAHIKAAVCSPGCFKKYHHE